MISRDLSACAINTATLGFQAPIEEVIEAVARAGFGGIAPWRREVEGDDVARSASSIRDAGPEGSAVIAAALIFPRLTAPDFVPMSKPTGAPSMTRPCSGLQVS